MTHAAERCVRSRLALRTLTVFFAAAPLAAAIRAPAADKLRVGSRAEWHPARTILVHTPGEELFLGVVHPDAALFEKTFSVERAAAEHREYIRLLREHGARVYTVVETLLEGTIDAGGRAVRGPKLDALRSFAKQFLTLDASALPAAMRGEQEAYKERTLRGLHPRELVRIILLHPTVHLARTARNTGFAATYEQAPVMNLYFLRDQMITTAKGVVIAKMSSAQRAAETRIIKFVLAKLGIKPIYEVTGRGRLEGGDYFSAGETALIGQGLRTNAEGIRQLLDSRVFGLRRVVVVKDPWQKQDQMHLDTYFNIISPTKAVLASERMSTPDRPAVKAMQSKVDVYELGENGYELKTRNADFQEYLEKQLGFRLIPVPKADQLRYGINFLTVRANRILAVDGVSAPYKEALRTAGVEAAWMDFQNLKCGYGAAHCTVQVLHREAISSENK